MNAQNRKTAPAPRYLCLFCGKRLGWVCKTEYAIDKTRPPRSCGSRRSTYENGFRDDFRCRSKAFTFSAAREAWTCNECGECHLGRRSVASRTRVYSAVGPNGDGFFCSKEHGWRFGVHAARKLVPPAPVSRLAPPRSPAPEAK